MFECVQELRHPSTKPSLAVNFPEWDPCVVHFVDYPSGVRTLADSSNGPASSSTPAYVHQKPSTVFRYTQTPPQDVGVSENSVALNPLVNDHYPY